MSNNKKIIELCPNYYRIIEFNPIDEDEISDKIIKIYKEFIFSININDESAVNEIKELDSALYKYIKDFSFRREIQNEIVKVKINKEDSNILKRFVDCILKIYANYEDFTTRVIYISRWI